MAEDRTYPPSREFVEHANVKGMDAYRALYQRAEEKPAEFWSELAEKELFWFEKWSKAFEWNPPAVKWFVGGKTNVSYNCVDRHLSTPRKNKVAILWEGEPGDQRMITYQELHRLVSRFANVLKSRGLKTGDRAIVYMPMIPELPVALLACARLGIIHSVVFGGFSAEALKARIQDLEAQVVITADGGWRRGKEVRLKPAVDDAVAECPTVRDVIVYRAPGERSSCARAATSGGTSSTRGRAKTAPPSRSIPKLRCSCSTLPAPQANPKASSTPPAAICCRPP